MSLFQVREWWSTLAGFEEFHTTGSLAVTKLDPSTSYNDCVFVSSFTGVLRAYRPIPGPFSPDHLLLETKLSAPIIQIGTGQLIIESIAAGLAVLHPRVLIIYSLVLNDNQLSLVLVKKHTLTHTSHSMIIGPFGGISNYDLVCVQSMDGQLYVLDHNGFVFSCIIPGFLLPGPIAYIPRTDTILTVGSGRRVESYRYKTLMSAGHGGTKKVTPDWSIELGESIVEIRIIRGEEEGPSLVLVLGEHILYCLKDSGSFVFVRKLDSSSSVVYPFVIKQGEIPVVQYILAGHSQQLQVMSNQTMIWAAQLPHVPVAITTANFRQLQGVIITLDEIGHLQCSYLGTDPTSFTSSLSTNRSIYSILSLQEMKEELKQLSSLIQDGEESVGKVTSEDEIEISVEGFSQPRPVVSDDDEEERKERQCVEANILIDCTNSVSAIFDVCVIMEVSKPISVHPSTINIPTIGDGSHNEQSLTFVCSDDISPGSFNISLTVTYTTKNGHTHTKDHTHSLPLGLFCKTCPPGDGQYKVTLDSSLPCISLNDIYQDNEQGHPSNAIAFKLLSGPIVTFIASKTSDRYRIQSDSFSALGLFICDFVQRLSQYYKDKSTKFRLKVSSTLPLPEYFELIEEHYKARVGLDQCRELLGRHAHQFRAIQKRLLSRFKDKTPASLSHLDTLLDGTYMQLMALGEKYDQFQFEEECSIRHLSSASLLIILLLKLSVGLTDEEESILRATLLPDIQLNTEQGWEEVVDTAIVQLLRTSLAKSVKDQSVTIPELVLPRDCQRVKRHIALLCDRLIKGGQLTATPSLDEIQPISTGRVKLPPLPEEESIETDQ